MSKKSFQTLCVSLAGLACVTWLVPVQLLAADQSLAGTTSRPVSLVRDVALGSGGSIAGQFLDAQGQPQPDQMLVVQHQDGRAFETRTDAQGRFAVQGLSGGIYQIGTAESGVVCRCWAERTAPPHAVQELLIVAGEGVQRGQRPIGELLFSGPVLIALVIAAAIAIPIAIHNSQDAS